MFFSDHQPNVIVINFNLIIPFFLNNYVLCITLGNLNWNLNIFNVTSVSLSTSCKTPIINNFWVIIILQSECLHNLHVSNYCHLHLVINLKLWDEQLCIQQMRRHNIEKSLSDCTCITPLCIILQQPQTETSSNLILCFTRMVFFFVYTNHQFSMLL